MEPSFFLGDIYHYTVLFLLRMLPSQVQHHRETCVWIWSDEVFKDCFLSWPWRLAWCSIHILVGRCAIFWSSYVGICRPGLLVKFPVIFRNLCAAFFWTPLLQGIVSQTGTVLISFDVQRISGRTKFTCWFWFSVRLPRKLFAVTGNYGFRITMGKPRFA